MSALGSDTASLEDYQQSHRARHTGKLLPLHAILQCSQEACQVLEVLWTNHPTTLYQHHPVSKGGDPQPHRPAGITGLALPPSKSLPEVQAVENPRVTLSTSSLPSRAAERVMGTTNSNSSLASLLGKVITQFQNPWKWKGSQARFH